MVTQFGMSPTLGNVDLQYSYAHLSSETKLAIESEVKRMINDAHTRALDLLASRREELDVLAKALVEYEVLSLEEMKKVLKGEKLAGKMKGMKGVGIKLPEIVLPKGMDDGGGGGAATTAATAAGTGTAGSNASAAASEALSGSRVAPPPEGFSGGRGGIGPSEAQ